jgi:hypothetical protein
MVRSGRSTWTSWLRHSSVPPLAVTTLILLALTWKVTSFDPLRVKIDPLDAPGDPPALSIDRDYRVTGRVDPGRNPYRAVDSVDLYFDALRMAGYYVSVGSARVTRFDRATGRFEGELKLPLYLLDLSQPRGDAKLMLRLRVRDVAGREYGLGTQPRSGPEFEVPVRIVPPGSPPLWLVDPGPERVALSAEARPRPRSVSESRDRIGTSERSDSNRGLSIEPGRGSGPPATPLRGQALLEPGQGRADVPDGLIPGLRPLG